MTGTWNQIYVREACVWIVIFETREVGLAKQNMGPRVAENLNFPFFMPSIVGKKFWKHILWLYECVHTGMIPGWSWVDPSWDDLSGSGKSFDWRQDGGVPLLLCSSRSLHMGGDFRRLPSLVLDFFPTSEISFPVPVLTFLGPFWFQVQTRAPQTLREKGMNFGVRFLLWLVDWSQVFRSVKVGRRKPIQRWNPSPSRCRPWIGLWPFVFLFNWFVSKSHGMRAAQDTLFCSTVDGGSEALPLTKDKQLDPLSVVVTSMAPNSVKAGGKNYALSANVSKTGGTSSLR